MELKELFVSLNPLFDENTAIGRLINKQNNMKTITITEENKSIIEALSKLNTGDKITFSENSILIEPKQEFKSGECLVVSICGEEKIIFAEEIQGEGEKQKIIFNKSCECVNASNVIRKATDEEIKSRIEYLNSKGKDWDDEKMEILDWVWKPKKGDEMYYIDCDSDYIHRFEFENEDYEPTIFDFRTKELAEAALQLLKNAKHF